MEKVAKFYKVSEKQFLLDGTKEEYDNILLPRRATQGSAGYDFFLPRAITLNPGETVKIPTGIRVKIKDGFFLAVFPRSGLGFKYRLTLNNTVGIIDSDYYFADNEGHIFVKLTNCGNLPLSLNRGDAFAQGIFLQYFVTEDDCAENVRTGGLGSTDKTKSY